MNENIMPMSVEDIDITPTAATIDSNGGLLLFTLNHYENWELTHKPDWCEVSPTTGASGVYQIEVTVSANELTEERKGDVEFIAGSGYADGYVHITQEAKQVEPVGKSPVRIGGLEIKKAYLGDKELTSKNAFIGVYNLIGGSGIDYDGLIFTALEDNSAVAMTHYGTNTGSTKPNLQYSKDGNNWVDWKGEEIALNKGEQVALRGTNTQIGRSTNAYSKFIVTGNVKASGNIMSLLDGGACTATTLTGTYNFGRLFLDAQALSDISELLLPATEVSNYAYVYMFANTGIIKSPKLQAWKVGTNSYQYMFNRCHKLIKAPEELPATTLASACYANMFQDCTSLEKAPILPYQNALPSGNGYNNLFSGATKVNYIECMCTGTTSFANWTKNVAPTGTFVKNTKALWTTEGINGVPVGWDVKYKGDTFVSISGYSADTPDSREFSFYVQSDSFNGNTWSATAPDWCTLSTYEKTADRVEVIVTLQRNYGNERSGNIIINATDATLTISVKQSAYIEYNFTNALTLTALEDSTINLQNYGTNQNDTKPCLLYSINNGEANWMEDEIINLNTGDEVRLVGYGMSSAENNYSTLNTTGKLKVSGKILSLLNPSNNLTEFPSGKIYVFRKLFVDGAIYDASELLFPTSTTGYCYDGMFMNNTQLTELPELPATTVSTGCYKQMFQGCTGLVELPDDYLPATNTNAGGAPNNSGQYQAMFKNCFNLKKACNLPMTTAPAHGYEEMFSGCVNLITPPIINATNLGDFGAFDHHNFKQMFEGCMNLVEAPVINKFTFKSTSTTYAKYASVLNSMYKDCINLNWICLLTTRLPQGGTGKEANTYKWVENVAPTGVFVKNILATWANEYQVGCIPVNWTVIYMDTADETYWLEQERITQCDKYGNVL